MEVDWGQDEERPGLFPVLLYRNETDAAEDKHKGCSCGYECTSGACCCYLGASDLSCTPPGGAACDSTQEVELPEAKTAKSSESLLTLAIAASSLRRDNENAAVPALAPAIGSDRKACKRCKELLPRSAFCANTRAPDGLYTQCRSCVSQKDHERRVRLKRQNKPPASNKSCSRCQVVKIKDEFYLDTSRPDGLQTYCKPCFSLAYKEKRKQRKVAA